MNQLFDWDINDVQLPTVNYHDAYDEWAEGHVKLVFGPNLDQAKRHASGWAMRNTNNHNVVILKKSCLGVLVCNRNCTSEFGDKAHLRPAICDKARKKQQGRPCPNHLCAGRLVVMPCRGHAGYPVTHFWRHTPQGVFFQAKGVHDHPRPEAKNNLEARKCGRSAVVAKAGSKYSTSTTWNRRKAGSCVTTKQLQSNAIAADYQKFQNSTVKRAPDSRQCRTAISEATVWDERHVLSIQYANPPMPVFESERPSQYFRHNVARNHWPENKGVEYAAETTVARPNNRVNLTCHFNDPHFDAPAQRSLVQPVHFTHPNTTATFDAWPSSIDCQLAEVDHLPQADQVHSEEDLDAFEPTFYPSNDSHCFQPAPVNHIHPGTSASRPWIIRQNVRETRHYETTISVDPQALHNSGFAVPEYPNGNYVPPNRYFCDEFLENPQVTVSGEDDSEFTNDYCYSGFEQSSLQPCYT